MTIPDRTYTITIPAELADVTRACWAALLAGLRNTLMDHDEITRTIDDEIPVPEGLRDLYVIADVDAHRTRIARIEIALGLLDKEAH